MDNRACNYCSQPFVPREAKVRFCSADCRVAYHDEERREGVARLRQERASEPSTYHAHAQANADTLGGRWAMQPKADPSTQSSPPLPVPNWAHDPVGTEPPLGLRVDDLPPEARS